MLLKKSERKNNCFGMYFWVFGVFCIMNCYFRCDYRIHCIFLYIWTYSKYRFWHFWRKNVPEVWTIFVRILFCDLGGFGGGPKCPPNHRHHHPPPSPIPGVNVKVPFRGTKYENGLRFLYIEMFWCFLRFWFGWVFGPKWSPPIPIPSVNDKVPFRGKNIENMFCCFYVIFVERK